METLLNPIWVSDLPTGSYPTYEEWKQCVMLGIYMLKRSSYPTYEEWKLTKNNAFRRKCTSSYPTYEEWKLPL